ncbi:MAG: flagellar hook-basal body protein FliE [Candidatus Liberibacter europaeus]|uniref:Flagellar hook-basal body complex protein FliE n=1 Tax=Candidatus Liberibacter europaeus TaxID=744859 RepID=A0A2T4VXN3_9HYPH|nr:flagellar hook-basal body protein FliE [Candidatus Liberibacter europaeus]PTL86534.1 MAG: flagellar hook-basal body protein FliE [Candidatus Liberibacter europaeus]
MMIEQVQGFDTSFYKGSTIGSQSDFIQNTQMQEEVSSIDFSSLLQDMAKEAVGTIKNAEEVSLDALQGKVSMREAIDSIIQAERTLQTSIALRDKIISSYLEISKMQI